MDPLLSLALNILPLGTYCLACYYTPSKFQLALAKVLTLGYTMLMLAVYLGLVVQVSEYFISFNYLSKGSLALLAAITFLRVC